MILSSKFQPQRRQFLKVGLLGSATLSIAACCVSDSRKSNIKDKFLWLKEDDHELLAALIPVMLDGALPDNNAAHSLAIKEIITGVDISVAHMLPTVRDEVRQLFSLLEFTPSRIVLAGIWSCWENASPRNISSFLACWKESDFDLLRIGYSALHDLITGAWYANPRSWARIHYPGPPLLT